ncbi:hypothetical protein KTD26_32210, partial [Burkholderia multivorans]|uniref:ATP-binding protein n=1 Tax=Burkholderia multivorans TaxID=87883 RepID=UPI001DFFA356|nr:hypothetical protein [Burkholderia multivorans]
PGFMWRFSLVPCSGGWSWKPDSLGFHWRTAAFNLQLRLGHCRAVSNLTSNALDHARPGSTIELAVSATQKYSVVSVTNQGPAIPVEQLDKIFERFYRADASRHGAAKNAGLGLAIVKSIMELHHGKVDVVSDGVRTTFTLYFPSDGAGQNAR